MSSLWPLIDWLPDLGTLPRRALRKAATPVESAGDRLWIKRDDLSADPIGGNKVRSLEWLLAPFAPGMTLATVGSRGSTHVLSTVLHARALGLDVHAGSWPQEMNEAARAVDARLDQLTERRRFGSPVSASLWLAWRSWRGQPTIPPGGTSPPGIIGHVNAAFELADQIRSNVLPTPHRVIVPLGTGGTAAGLALGFRLAGVRTTVVGARVVPRLIGRASRVRRLARATRRFMERVSGASLDAGEISIEVDDGVYGGAYGRPLAHAPAAAPGGIRLDATYSAKAFLAARESARVADTLFWLTFDSRWMTHDRHRYG